MSLCAPVSARGSINPFDGNESLDNSFYMPSTSRRDLKESSDDKPQFLAFKSHHDGFSGTGAFNNFHAKRVGSLPVSNANLRGGDRARVYGIGTA